MTDTETTASIYDNLPSEQPFFTEDALDKMMYRTKHDMKHEHEIEYFDEIIQCEVDGKLKQCYFHAWKTKSCGHAKCHHPLHSIMPLMPYKIEFSPSPSKT